MKIGILCNSILAIPALQFLQNNGLQIAVCVPNIVNDDTPELQNFFAVTNIVVDKVDKPALSSHLKKWIAINKPDVVFVITFPWKIPGHILPLPRLGFFNFHYALLPAYRGASPIFWQLRNGEQFGGLTIHRMDAGWDTGPIAHIHKVPILQGETFGMHHRRIAWDTMQGVVEFMQKLILLGNALPLTPQDNESAQYFPNPTAKDVSINWQLMPARQIQNLVNACNPWNKGAVAKHQNNVFKIVQVSVKEHGIVYNQKLIPGTVINSSEKRTVNIITVDDMIVCCEVIATDEGIYTADFLFKLGIKEGSLIE
jgi:methionyl-tRNA formyltransferase